MERYTQRQFLNALTRAALAAEAIGSLNESETLLRQALGHAKRAFGSNHPQYAAMLIHLAETCAGQSNFSEAERCYDEAIIVLTDNYGASHPSVAIGYRNLSEILKEQGRLSEAADAAFRARIIFADSNCLAGN